MSNNRGLAEKLPTLTSSETENTPARPKVMRRPAQFSDARPKSESATINILPADEKIDENENLSLTAPTPAIPTAKPWQDDIRFGLVMIAIVVVVNLVLMAWLPHMRPAISTPDADAAPASGSVMTPADRTFKFYTKPGTEPASIAHETITTETPHVLSGADSGPNQ